MTLACWKKELFRFIETQSPWRYIKLVTHLPNIPKFLMQNRLPNNELSRLLLNIFEIVNVDVKELYVIFLYVGYRKLFSLTFLIPQAFRLIVIAAL